MTKGALIPTKFFLRKIDRFVLKKSTDHLRETVLFFRQACLLKFASLMYLNFISFASIQPIMSRNAFHVFRIFFRCSLYRPIIMNFDVNNFSSTSRL